MLLLRRGVTVSQRQLCRPPSPWHQRLLVRRFCNNKNVGDREKTDSGLHGKPTLFERFKLGLLPYRIGARKLVTNMEVAYSLITKSLVDLDHRMTKRERKLVLRTVFDITKLLPFAIIAAAPGGSLLIPVLVKFLPISLPTTFKLPTKEELQEAYQTDSEKDMKDDIDKKLKIAVKNMVKTMHDNQVKEYQQIRDLLEHASDTANPGSMPNRYQLIYSKFSEEEYLEMMNIAQLKALVSFFNLNAGQSAAYLESYAFDRYHFSILRYQLIKHISRLNSEDVMLAEERPKNLPDEELVKACIDRGLVPPSTFPTSSSPSPSPSSSSSTPSPTPLQPHVRQELVKKLNEWLLSTIGRHVPIALLAFGHVQGDHNE